MKPVYIMAPLIPGTVTPIKCKAPRQKRAKRKEVPVEYRKNRMAKLKDDIFYFKQDIKRFFRRKETKQ